MFYSTDSPQSLNAALFPSSGEHCDQELLIESIFDMQRNYNG